MDGEHNTPAAKACSPAPDIAHTFANEETRAAKTYNHTRKPGMRRPAEIGLERAPFGPPIETERQLRHDPGRSPDLRID